MATGRGNADAKAVGHESVWHTTGTIEERQQELGSRYQERRWSGDKGEEWTERRP